MWHSHRAASSLHSGRAACQDSSAAGLMQLHTACLLATLRYSNLDTGIARVRAQQCQS